MNFNFSAVIKTLLINGLTFCIAISLSGGSSIPLPPSGYKRQIAEKPTGKKVKISNKISEILITPAYETAGVIITTGAEKVKLEIKNKNGKFTECHPFIRFDREHMASSIFNLEAGKKYTIRIQRKILKTFQTLTEIKPVPPKKIVKLKPGDSINKTLKKITPGTTVLLTPGVYKEGNISFSELKGTADAPIILKGDIPASELKKHITKRNLPTIDAAGFNYAIMVFASQHIIIENIRIKYGKKTGVRFTKSQWSVLRNSQIYDNGRYNVLITKGGKDQHHILIDGNHIADKEHADPFSFSVKVPKDITYYGIKRDNNPGWATVIRNNFIEGVADGIASGGDESQCAAANLNMTDIRKKWPNYELDVYNNVIIDCRDDAIETDGISINCRFYSNYLDGTANGISIAPSLPGPFFILRNIIINFNESSVKINTKAGRGVIRNAFFYHNTIVREKKTKNGKGALLNIWDGAASQNIVFMNNIFAGVERCVQIQPKRTHKPKFDYNLWYTPDPNSFYWWKGPLWRKNFSEGWVKELGCDKNGLWADPKLDSKMNLSKNSPAIDRGIIIQGVNDEFTGKAPDIGAVEYK